MHKRERIISLLLLLTIALYLGGSTLFIHSHNIDGRSIVHSHPFSGTPASHSHTAISLDTISRICGGEYVASSSVDIEVNLSTQHALYTTPHIEHHCSAYLRLNSLRAPPARA